MCKRINKKESCRRQSPKKSSYKKNANTRNMKLLYQFLVLVGVLILAGSAINLQIESPVVWTFLYGIGGWAALTTNPGSPIR